jgi:hypothetical protein
MATYFGHATADEMFSDGMIVTRKVVDAEAVRAFVEQGVTSALNPSHKATIDAMCVRFGLNVEIPEKAPMVKLQPGDKFIVMSVRGLPLEEQGKGEYTADEIAGAMFEFSVWEVQPEKSFVVSDLYLRRAVGAINSVASSLGMYVGDYVLDEYARAVLENRSDDVKNLERLMALQQAGKIQYINTRAGL